jgi:hypothetical protein
LYEDVYPNYIVAYHRTNKKPDEFIDSTNKIGISVGGGGSIGRYGYGFYANLTWSETLKNEKFGSYIWKVLIKHKNLISFDESTQKIIFGDITPIDKQFDYWKIKLTSEQREVLSKMTSDSDNARAFINKFLFKTSFLSRESKIMFPIEGVIYNEIGKDGYSIVMYDVNKVSLDGYYDQSSTSSDINKFHKIEHKIHNKKNIIKQSN